MDDKSIEKLLKKSKLASAYAMLPSPELRRAIAIEYGRLLGENDLSDQCWPGISGLPFFRPLHSTAVCKNMDIPNLPPSWQFVLRY